MLAYACRNFLQKGSSHWQLARWILGTMAAETVLLTGVWVYPGVWIPYRVTYRCLSMPRCLDPKARLQCHTGVWIPNRGYIQVFGVPTAATPGCLESPNWGYTGVLCLEPQMGNPASCQASRHRLSAFGRLSKWTP